MSFFIKFICKFQICLYFCPRKLITTFNGTNV
nr:MAG TPA: hypothetical protein [Caudoviricetes sp.]